MKKLTFFVIIIIAILFVFSKKDKNAINMQRLRVGMTISEVQIIMGEPYRVDTYSIGPDSLIGYYYINNELGASGHYHVTFSHSDKKVVGIDFGT